MSCLWATNWAAKAIDLHELHLRDNKQAAFKHMSFPTVSLWLPAVWDVYRNHWRYGENIFLTIPFVQPLADMPLAHNCWLRWLHIILGNKIKKWQLNQCYHWFIQTHNLITCKKPFLPPISADSDSPTAVVPVGPVWPSDISPGGILIEQVPLMCKRNTRQQQQSLNSIQWQPRHLCCLPFANVKIRLGMW